MAELLDLRPGRVNMIAYRGDDFNRDVAIENEAGVGYALSDAKMQIKDLNGLAAISLTVGAGLTIATGLVSIAITKTVLAAATATDFQYDLEVTFTATGKKRTVISGEFSIPADITI